MELLDAYARIQERAGLPPMRQGAPRLEHRQIIADPEQVWLAFRAGRPVRGWMQFQSHQQVFLDGLPEAPDSAWGFLLAAEAVDADGGTHRLRQNGSAGWIASSHRHDENGDGLWDEVSHLLHGADGMLRYRRYWEARGGRGVVQTIACLIGIELGKATSEEEK